MVNDKTTGSFFTPDDLARSVVRHLDSHLSRSARFGLTALEPSVGEGAFLRALAEIQGQDRRIASVDVVDIEPTFIEESRGVALPGAEVVYVCEDFITFEGSSSGYDLIVGKVFLTDEVVVPSGIDVGNNSKIVRIPKPLRQTLEGAG